MTRAIRNDKTISGMLIAAIPLAFLIGCGVEVGNPTTGKGGKNIETLPDENLALTSEVVSAQLDEVLATISEQYESMDGSTLQFRLNASDPSSFGTPMMQKRPDNMDMLKDGDIRNFPKQPINHDFQCSDSSGQITVHRTVDHKAPETVNDGSFGRVFDMSFEDSMTATFSTPEGNISCDSGAKRAFVDIRKLASWDSDISYKKSHKRTIRRPGTDSSEVVRNDVVLAQGQRKIHFARVSSDPLTIEQTITKEGSRAIHWENPIAGQLDLNSNIKTLENAPLVILYTYPKGSRTPSQRLIQSGSLLSTQDDGSQVKMNFDNVMFDNDHQCLPISGTISGSLLKPDGHEIDQSQFVLDFSSDQPTLKRTNGSIANIYLDYCSFD